MWLWRPAEILLGAVFVTGALLKAADVNLFVVQITHYGVLSDPGFVSAAALGTLWVEIWLGCALVLGARLLGMVHAAVLALLVVFTGLIGYAWAFHGIQDCGCFGPIEMSPGVSIGKNAVLILLCLFAWRGCWRSPQLSASRRSVLIRYGISVVAACGVASYAYAHLEAAPKKDGAFSEFVFEVDGEKYDLGIGEYFVPVLSMTCDHCMASVEKINALMETPGFPQVAALCYEEAEGGLADFEARTGPGFPLHSLGSSIRTFFNLIGQAPPRFYLIRDGQPVKFWDETVPSAEEVSAARGGAS